MTEQQNNQDNQVDDVAGFCEAVAKVTGNPKAQELADQVREFDKKWGTGPKRK